MQRHWGSPSSISSNSIVGREEAEVKTYFFKVNIGAMMACYAFADVKMCTGSGSGCLRSPTGYWTTHVGTFLAKDFRGTMPWWLQNPP